MQKNRWMIGMVSLLLMTTLTGCGPVKNNSQAANGSHTQVKSQRAQLQAHSDQITEQFLNVVHQHRRQKIGTQQHVDTNLKRAISWANYVYIVSEPYDQDSQSIARQLTTGQIDNSTNNLANGYGYFDAKVAQQAARQITRAAQAIVKYNYQHQEHPLVNNAMQS